MRIYWAILSIGLAGAAGAGEVEEWRPDMIVNPAFLSDHEVVDDIEPGRIHLRLSNGTPNIGLGVLHMYGVVPANPDGTQDVMQRVFNSDGTYTDYPSGRFVYHEEHNHIHVENWAEYRIREITFTGEPGEVLARGVKTSYCLRDSKVYDYTLPNFVYPGQYGDCDGLRQGISVGFEDVYTKNLPDQWIDITDLPPGEYWLESVVDPENHVLESDETNNTARIRITIGEPGPRSPFALLRAYLMLLIQQILSLIRGILGLPLVLSWS